MSRSLAVAFAITLAAAVVLAQPAAVLPAAPGGTPVKTATVSGTVKSSEGAPLAKATLRLRRSSSPPAGADPDALPMTIESVNQADGKFVIKDVIPADYTLSAERAGFVLQAFGARKPGGPGVTMRISPGEDLTGLTITMLPQGLIYGTVTDADGDLLSGGARVEVTRFSYDNNGKRGLSPEGVSGSTDVDPDGGFVIGNLTPGRYYISATNGQRRYGPRGFRQQVQGSQLQTVKTYYPNAVDLNSASALDVQAGAVLRGINIRLQSAAAYEIRGTLANIPALDAKQLEGCNASVLLLDPRIAQPWMQRVAPASCRNGTFVIRGVAPGEYRLAVTMEFGYDPRYGPRGDANRLGGQSTITIRGDDVAGVTVPLQPGLDIRGTVKLEGSNTPPETVINVNSEIARSDDDAVPENGAFLLKSLLPAPYSIDVSKTPPGAYLKSIRYAGAEIDGNGGLDLTNSSAAGQLEILFAPGAAEINGTVRNKAGELAKNVTVIAWRPKAQGIQLNPVQNRRTDNAGTFSVKNLAPGVYYVAAWEELDNGLSGNRDFLARFESVAVKVELTEGSKAAAAPLISSEATEAEIAKLP